jgi:hypothetical protein
MNTNIFTIFKAAFTDMFDKKILTLSLVPIAIAALVWGLIFFLFDSYIHAFFMGLLSYIPFIGTKQWFIDSVQTFSLVFLYYQLMIITAVTIVGIIADDVVAHVNKKHYALEVKGFGTLIGSLTLSLKHNLIFILLFIILIPAMFIPVVNIFINIFLWMVLLKAPMFYDSLASIATKDEYITLSSTNKMQIRTITFISAALFLIPILGIVIYILQLLVFTHFNLSRLQKLRTEVVMPIN